MTDTLTPELQQQNLINRYRNILDDIRDWRTMLGDTMLTITGYSMDLTGIPSSGEAPMPGGDALAMLGPWSPDADHGDDLPHPDQILREWRDTITGEHHRGPWVECWRWHRDQTPHLLETQYADAWRTDIDTLWSRLAHLTGHAPAKPETPPTTLGDILDALRNNPEHRLTRRELGTILDIPPSTITTWRSRGLTTDEHGTYRAGDIIERIAP